MASGGFLAVDQLVVNHYLEPAPAGGKQEYALDHRGVEVQQFFRQTDGAWGVVSHHAEFDADLILLHATFLPSVEPNRIGVAGQAGVGRDEKDL